MSYVGDTREPGFSHLAQPTIHLTNPCTEIVLTREMIENDMSSIMETIQQEVLRGMRKTIDKWWTDMNGPY